MTEDQDPARFQNLSYEGFRKLASDPDPELSEYNRIGFPDSYREGFEPAIFADILRKLPALAVRGRKILDIGPGCSGLTTSLIEYCSDLDHTLVLCDSEEMLARIPAAPCVRKVTGPFPECAARVAGILPSFDSILCYSVAHYIHPTTGLEKMADAILSLLTSPAECLIGEIPNISMRKRFFSSPAGRSYHRAYTGRDEDPVDILNENESGHINDEIILALLHRFRRAGADAFAVPQPADLPLFNRREDILVRVP